MKNKKGFTLIELLAVIALIGVLLVLVVPRVVKVFSSAKKEAFVTQAERIVSVATSAYADSLANNEIQVGTMGIYCDDATQSEIGVSCRKLDLSNSDVRYLTVIAPGGKTSGIAVFEGDYCYSATNNNDGIDINNVYKNASFTCSNTSGCVCTGGTLDSSESTGSNTESNTGNSGSNSGSNTGGSGLDKIDFGDLINNGGSSSLPKFWSYDEGLDSNGVPLIFSGSSIPSTTYTLPLQVSSEERFVYVASSLGTDGNYTHKVCVSILNKTFCAETNYWTLNANSTLSKIQNALNSIYDTTSSSSSGSLMENQYEVSDYGTFSCTINASSDMVSCSNNALEISVKSNGDVAATYHINESYSNESYRSCIVYSNNSTKCVPYSFTNPVVPGQSGSDTI